jgi:hypothetical protein
MDQQRREACGGASRALASAGGGEEGGEGLAHHLRLRPRPQRHAQQGFAPPFVQRRIGAKVRLGDRARPRQKSVRVWLGCEGAHASRPVLLIAV